MLELLQGNRRMTVGALAERLGVDERTVRRYAGTLADLGIPVTATRGRYGGYRLLPGFKLPPLMLTDDEAVAVVLGLIAADRLGLTAEAPAAAAAAAKIARVLPAALCGRLAALRENLGFTMREAGRHDTPDTATLLELGAAARSHQRLTLTYRDRLDDVSTRDFDPYGLVFHSGRWYAVGHDHRSGEIRSLRADRMEVTPTGTRFVPPPDFDAVDHLNRQWAAREYRWRVEVVIDGDLAELRRRVPAAMAELIDTDSGVLMRCRAERLDGMAQMLAGLGRPFTVRAPDELRTAVAEYADRLAEWSARLA
jgi:predicted DNA-binding transcriptional regulator YafY